MGLFARLIFTILLFIKVFTSSAQVSLDKIHVIPEISIGYILGVSFVWGFDVNLTSFDLKVSDKITCSTGIGLSYNCFKFGGSKFNSYSFNLVNFSDYSQIKIGGNWITTKWGANKVNKTHSYNLGFNLEVGGSPGEYFPWLTFRTFGESNKCLWLPLRKQYQFNMKYLMDIPIQMKR